MYNELNLPSEQHLGDVSMYDTYDALGTKLRRNCVEAGNPALHYDTPRYYVDDIEYVGAGVKRIHLIQFEDGYIDSSLQNFCFFYKDHLNSVRKVVSKNMLTGAITNLGSTDYYPFGKPLYTLNGNNRYLYNGKELQDETGFYDYGARMYDPDMGRWMAVDPMANLLVFTSSYAYCLNNPIIYEDKAGKLPILINGRTIADSERHDPSYWDKSIIDIIKNSGIPNPGGTVKFVDGNQTFSNLTGENRNAGLFSGNNPGSRIAAGFLQGIKDIPNILSLLEKDGNGQYSEKIQIYAHSRGAAFSEGYIAAILDYIEKHPNEFVDPKHVINLAVYLAPHQSYALSNFTNVPAVSINDDADGYSGNKMKGTFANITTYISGIEDTHGTKSFGVQFDIFLQLFQKNGLTNSTIFNFVGLLEAAGIPVTVK